MTSAPHTDFSAIAPLVELGSGGQGKVFSTSRSLKEPPLPLVYKEYLAMVASSIDDSVLTSMSALLERLPMAESLPLLAHAAWPCLIVEKSGQVSGFLMPSIPDEFRLTMQLSSGPKKVLGEFQHLLNDESYLARRGIKLNDKGRYELLHATATTLSMLHGHQIAVGDLSPKNLLFSLNPKPEVFFIDCDAMSFQGNSVTNQFETPGWEVRAVSPGEELATHKSDSLKLGLLALRLFALDQSTWDIAKVPKSVPSDIRTLIERSISRKVDQRPTPDEWLAPLETAAKTASTAMPKLAPTQTAGATSANALTIAMAPVSPRKNLQPPAPSGTQVSANRVQPTGPTAPPSTAGSSDSHRGKIAVAALAAIVLLVIIFANLGSGSNNGSTAAGNSAGASSPTGLGSNADPSTTTTQTPSSPGTPIATVQLSSQGSQAMAIVQNLASSLANHDWSQAQSIDPTMPDEATLANDYNALSKSTVIVTSSSDDGTTETLRGGYVAWETVGGNQRTSIYCGQWIVDLGSNTVTSATSIGSNDVGYAQDWTDPATAMGTVKNLCV